MSWRWLRVGIAVMAFAALFSGAVAHAHPLDLHDALAFEVASSAASCGFCASVRGSVLPFTPELTRVPPESFRLEVAAACNVFASPTSLLRPRAPPSS